MKKHSTQISQHCLLFWSFEGLITHKILLIKNSNSLRNWSKPDGFISWKLCQTALPISINISYELVTKVWVELIFFIKLLWLKIFCDTLEQSIPPCWKKINFIKNLFNMIDKCLGFVLNNNIWYKNVIIQWVCCLYFVIMHFNIRYVIPLRLLCHTLKIYWFIERL